MADDPPISRFGVPPLTELPDDLRERIEAIAAKTGFVPNVFAAMAARPAELRAFMAYHDAVMDGPSTLTAAEKEMIVVATSAANDCLYCVVAHGAILRIRAKDPLIADRVAINHHKAGLDERHVAMLDFAVLVATESASITDDDLDELRRHGFDDDDIWDIGAIASLFALSNRMADLTALQPNAEFYGMAR